jgi:hypothetical protein
VLDNLRSSIRGQEIADPDPYWIEGALTAGGVTTTVEIGTMPNPKVWREEIEAEITQQFARRAQRDVERQARMWGRRR